MNVGIFGGTFNPIHFGHLRAGEEALEALNLDEMIFVPAKLPPHKSECRIASPDLRLKLVNTAIRGNPRFTASGVELERPGKSYTVDTLEYFRQLHGDSAQLWFLMGMDSFLEVHTWYRPERIFSLVNVAVVNRPGFVFEDVIGRFDCGFTAHAGGYINKYERFLRFIDMTPMGISSTDIRRRLSRGASVKYLVPEAVEELLKENQEIL